jgi:hexosaminidase
MLQRLAGAEAGELQRLADVVEPLEDYQRGDIHDYTQQSPLNRLVDAVPSESDEAREFAAQVDALLTDPERRAGRAAIRARLQEWQGLAARLRPLLEARELLHELLPLAEQASAVAGAGLEALDFLEQGVPAPEAWSQERARLLEAPKKPAHILEVAYVPAVKKLLDAVAR